MRLRVRAPAPFFVAGTNGSLGRCYRGTASHCWVYNPQYPDDYDAYVFVEPGTTAVASRNVVVEEVPDGEPACP
jgi:hypothetical protein